MKLLALAFICLLPSAAALDISISEINQPLIVGANAVDVDVTITELCIELLENNPTSIAAPTGLVELTHETNDAGTFISGPSNVQLTCEPLDEVATETVTMTMAAEPNAKAGSHQVSMTALFNEAVATNTTQYEVDPYFLISMRIESRIAEVNAGTDYTAEFPVTIENFGNSDVLVSFELTDHFEGGKLFFPEPVIIALGGEQDLVITGQYTGESPGNDQISLTFQANPKDPLGIAEGLPIRGNLILRANDFQVDNMLAETSQTQESPAGLTVLILGLASVALIARKIERKA